MIFLWISLLVSITRPLKCKRKCKSVSGTAYQRPSFPRNDHGRFPSNSQHRTDQDGATHVKFNYIWRVHLLALKRLLTPQVAWPGPSKNLPQQDFRLWKICHRRSAGKCKGRGRAEGGWIRQFFWVIFFLQIRLCRYFFLDRANWRQFV